MNLSSRIASVERRLASHNPVALAAHHEAAHAAIGWMMGETVRTPGLVVDCAGNGRAHVDSGVAMPRSQAPRSIHKLLDATAAMNIAKLVGGYAAEWRFAGCQPPSAYRPWRSDDYIRAFKFAATYWEVGIESVAAKRIVTAAERRCNAILEQTEVWGVVKTIAERLIELGAVPESEADNLLRAHLGEGWLSSGERVIS